MYSWPCEISSEIHIFNSGYQSSGQTYFYVSMYVRICGYFSKSNGAREQEVWETLCQQMRAMYTDTQIRVENVGWGGGNKAGNARNDT